MRNWGICGIAGLLLAVVAFVYWPVVHFDFVWDDWQSFHDTAWLTRGGDWEHYVFRDFNNWTVYFRPLVVAFLALQVHVFDSTPGPMHVVSLALHLIDTLLVGALAWRCSLPIYKGRPQQIGMASLSMLVYGLHPVLVEPVAWIGCQYDLMATMFMLLGLLLNACIQPDAIRAPVIGLIFFLAACSKESAMSFPFLVLIFDWALAPNEAPFQPISAIRNIIRQRWKTYAGIIVAGLLYLALRNWDWEESWEGCGTNRQPPTPRRSCKGYKKFALPICITGEHCSGPCQKWGHYILSIPIGLRLSLHRPSPFAR
jgi:hypothetical protein